MRRSAITRKDIEIIKGCSKKTALKLLNTMRDVLSKQPHQTITIREYCKYEGLNYEEVITDLGMK
jgi:hypothetical protein